MDGVILVLIFIPIPITKLAIYNNDHLGLLYHDTTKQTHLFGEKGFFFATLHTTLLL